MKFKNSFLSYCTMYFFYFFSFNLISGLISVYMLDLGYSALHVGTLISCGYIFSMIVQPVVGNTADRYDYKKVNACIFILSAICAILFICFKSFILLVIIYASALSLFNATNASIERLGTYSTYDYGKMRIWGTIGYAVGSPVAGFLYDYISPDTMFIVYVLGILLCIYCMNNTQDVTIQKKTLIHQKMQWTKQYCMYLVVVFLFYGITNINTTYLPAMFQENGMSISTFSNMIFFVTIAEIPVLLYAPKKLHQFEISHMLAFTFAVLIIQFVTYVFIPFISMHVLVTIIFKTLPTILFIVLNMQVVATLVDEAFQIRALSYVQSIKFLASILFQYIARILIDYMSYRTLYIFLLVFSVIGLLICLKTKYQKIGKSIYE